MHMRLHETRCQTTSADNRLFADNLLRSLRKRYTGIYSHLNVIGERNVEQLSFENNIYFAVATLDSQVGFKYV